MNNRRQFVVKSGSVAISLSYLTGASQRLAAGPRATGKLRLASVGVGGMGASDLSSLSSHEKVEVVALCDVDQANLEAAAKLHPSAKLFRDYREMLDKIGSEIDAVNVATPDHMHAPVAMLAMLHDKHVYCQKPLTHDVYESRQLAKVAHEKDLVTQMGTQIHSASEYRTAVQLVQSGVVGKIREVHSWSDKTWGYDGPVPQSAPVPETLDWNLWLGTAPERPYAAGHYHPADWRRWCDFGCGTMGDMAIHILDPVFNALKLTSPQTIKSTSDTPATESYGLQNAVEFSFPATAYTTDNFKLTWHDGGAMPDISEWPLSMVQEEGKEARPDYPGQGSMFVGEKGYILLPHIAMPMLLPEKDFAESKIDPVDGGDHYHLWVDACLGGAPTTASFSYAGPLTEAVLLGVLANRFPHQELAWDSASMHITNFEDANSRIRRAYRQEFETENL